MKNLLTAVVMSLSVVSLCVISRAQAEGFFGGEERVRDFIVQDSIVTNLSVMDSLGWRRSALKQLPWSDTSWPDLLGSIAQPYEGLSLFRTNGWKHNRELIMNPKRWEKVLRWNSLSESELRDLSPAEKYDIAMGDSEFTLTRSVIGRIDDVWKRGRAAMFAGICDGWSAAAIHYPRPSRPVDVAAPDGMGGVRMIRFYPSDIRALMSFLWAESPEQWKAHIDGWQCATDDYDVHTNWEGRRLHPACADVNPGFFHLVAVNQLNLNQSGFIIDRKNNYEVFNHPVFKYEYRYFDPISGKEADSLLKAIRSISSLRHCEKPKVIDYRDPRTWRDQRECLSHGIFRDPRAVNLVGIRGTIHYLMEVEPEHRTHESPVQDHKEKLEVQYDLELDADGKIIGGEWRPYQVHSAPNMSESVNYEHPDILWLVQRGLKPDSIADSPELDQVDWDPQLPLPAEWRAAAKRASQNVNTWLKAPEPMPLRRFVDELSRSSRE